MPDTISSSIGPEQALKRLYAGIRRRLRLRRSLEAVTVAALILLPIAILAAGIMAWFRFEASAVDIARYTVYAIALLLTLAVLVRIGQRLSDRRVARYVETRQPALDALLVSAVEARESLQNPGADTSPALARRLIAQAVQYGQQSAGIGTLEHQRLKQAGAVLSGTLALAAVLTLFGPAPLRHGLGLLVNPGDDPAADNPFTLSVTPGDSTVLAGDDLRIAATPTYFRPERLELVSRSGPDQPWTRTPMTVSTDPDQYETFLFNLDRSQQYYVDAGDIRSDPFTVEVIPRPSVERIDLSYIYPAHTGRPPEQVENGGNIQAVQGTQVSVRVKPSQPVASGRLLIDGEQVVPLTAVDGILQGTLTLQDSGYYHVELPVREQLAPASPEYAIDTWADRLPTVSLRSPGRDSKATVIEEIGFAVEAEDDVALNALELVMSINGGEDEVASLTDGEAAATELTAGHTLYLEQRSLQPGDMIAYYVRARDSSEASRQVTTDMYFVDIRPFEQNFRRSANGGGGGGGGGGQNQSELSAQQRSLVVALFKTDRDHDSLSAEDLQNRLQTLTDAQTRIRDRVDAIVRRLTARPVVELNKGYRRMAEELPKASQAMIEAEATISADDLDQALPAARQALLHLQRADAAFRDVQVAQSQSGGGGGGSASADDLNNLFRLEMDKFRNPYADVQRGQQQAPDQQQIDETLRKLEELARRQQQELERALRRDDTGQGSTDSQQALIEELEQMAQELERLSRERQDRQLADTADRLQAAADAMRQSADSSGRSGSASASAEALDQLRQAQQTLDGQNRNRLAGDINNALRRSDSALDEQQALEQALQQDDLDSRSSIALAERKQALAGQLTELNRELTELAEQAGQQQQAKARRQLREAGETLTEDRLAERLRQGSEQLIADPDARDQNTEQTLTQALTDARDRIEAALDSVNGQSGNNRQQTREAIRSLVETLETTRGQQLDQARTGEARTGEARTGGQSRSGPSVGGRGYDADSGTAPIDFPPALRDQTRRLARSAAGLDGDSIPAQDIQSLISSIDQQLQKGDSTDLATLTGWLDALKLAEHQLREATDDPSPAVVVATQRPEPAAIDRDQVERYYRQLSEQTLPE